VRLEEIAPKKRLSGLVPGEAVTVVGLAWHGDDAVEITYRTASGNLHDRLVYRGDADALALAFESVLEPALG
jgi:hypothetical protein